MSVVLPTDKASKFLDCFLKESEQFTRDISKKSNRPFFSRTFIDSYKEKKNKNNVSLLNIRFSAVNSIYVPFMLGYVNMFDHSSDCRKYSLISLKKAIKLFNIKRCIISSVEPVNEVKESIDYDRDGEDVIYYNDSFTSDIETKLNDDETI